MGGSFDWENWDVAAFLANGGWFYSFALEICLSLNGYSSNVHQNMITVVQQWQVWNFGQIQNSRKVLHISPSQVSYGFFFCEFFGQKWLIYPECMVLSDGRFGKMDLISCSSFSSPRASALHISDTKQEFYSEILEVTRCGFEVVWLLWNWWITHQHCSNFTMIW